MNFDDYYYKVYLPLHQNKICRKLHVVGQMLTITFVIGTILLSMFSSGWWLLLLLAAPFIVYPFAWTGHFFFEKNEPAAFSNPILAKLSDWRMFYDILKGRIKI